ncbi:MAG: ATP-binding cassette domain-containing protein, partial [Alphaproteobacteria bacterium]|nr:ATP-binding cassette domain-containing protein [Alphaproteobacteria bacterium]
MNNHQIKIKNISLKFPHKTCFEDFSTIVYEGSKIGIIGRNGSGKSTLLKMILGMIDFEGDIELNGLTVAYVPQIISDHNSLSGGQRFNKSLSKSLSKRPDILLLDEPTNHLDSHNRNSLMRMLERYRGTLIIATHDVELLRNSIDILWHIDNGEIRVSHGNYDDYMCELGIKRESIEDKISALSHHKREAHKGLMREQKRAKSSKAQGEKNITNRKWPTLVSHAKVRRAQETSGKKKLAIRDKREDLIDQLSNIRIAEIITPKFSLSSSEIGRGNIVQINNGQIGYEDIIASDINFALAGNERVAILGKNG